MPTSAAVASRAPHVAHPHPAHAVAAGKREQSASAAEAALDAARNRVLPGQQTAAASQPVAAADDAEKAPAARLDTARMEAMRRVRSAQPAVALASSHSAAQPVAQKRDTAVQPPKTGDAEPSDFEKLLEAELDASGVFAGQAPQVQGDTRVTHAAATGGLAPPVRVTPPITGTTPDISSEEDVARLLGEIAVNRKP